MRALGWVQGPFRTDMPFRRKICDPCDAHHSVTIRLALYSKKSLWRGGRNAQSICDDGARGGRRQTMRAFAIRVVSAARGRGALRVGDAAFLIRRP